MKKILLMLALMLPCLGAWAETQTPVLTYENITAPQELSAEDATKIREISTAMTIVAEVEIANSSNWSLLFSAVADYTSNSTANNAIWGLGIGGNSLRYYVGPRDGGWYSSTNGDVTTSTKKIVFTYNGTTIKRYVDGAPKGQVSSTKALNDFSGGNAKFYLGGVVYNTSTEWGSIKNNVSITSIKFYNSVLNDDEVAVMCYPANAVTDYTKFVSGNVYTFQTKRGWLMTNEGTDFVYCSGKLNGVTPAEDNVNCQWVYYATEKGKYLYNVGVNKFISYNSANFDLIPLADAPTTSVLEFKNSTVGAYPILLGIEKKAVNHNLTNSKFTYGALLWGDGWTGYLGDDGSATLALSQGAATQETLDAIKDKVDYFEVMAELQYLYDNTTFSMDDRIGHFAYEYGYVLDRVLTYPESYQNVNDLKLLAENYRKSLIMPTGGKFLRIKAVADWNNDNPYLGAKNTTTKDKDTRAEFVADADKNTIFYYDGNYLVSFGSGNYLVSNSNFLGYSGVQTSGTKFAFDLASNNLLGAYNISFNDGGRWLYCNQDDYTDAGGRGTQNGYCFNLEEVTEIPVTISAAKYASFYAPVALTVPAGVTAYYINSKTETANGEVWAHLEAIGSVIPAGTGVILYADVEEATTFNLTIPTEDVEVNAIENNWLTGTTASAYISEESYVLSQKNNIAGLYIAELDQQLDQQGNKTWLNNGFKAYLPVTATGGTPSNVLRFTFGGNTTAIESVLNNGADANAPIYDLSGRRVMNTVKGGIYIQNGKKFIVK